jgi:hypothetical protein
MIIFIKTDKHTVSVDVELEDTVKSLKEKVSQRTDCPVGQFDLIFAGRKLTDGTLAKYEIEKESTLHMKKIVSVKLFAEYKGVTKEVSIPNAPGVTIRDLKRFVLL